MISRRQSLQFLTSAFAFSLAAGCQTAVPLTVAGENKQALKLSLAQWSLHRHLFGLSWPELSAKYTMSELIEGLATQHSEIVAGPLDPLDFATFARDEFDISAVEYVNTFYFDKVGNDAYIAKLDRKAKDAGVRSVLVMCDGLGDLGAADQASRIEAVNRHIGWLEFASALGCHSIRVNARTDATLSREEQSRLATDGLRRLCEKAEPFRLNVIVENHGGTSSDGAWLSRTIRNVDHPLAGTLPDFGNFQVTPDQQYDRYKGVAELMPYARGVSAKSYAFDPDTGLESTMDYARLLDIVRHSHFSGYIGVEYEGSQLSEIDGIKATKRLIERLY